MYTRFGLSCLVLAVLLAGCEHADPLTPDGGQGPTFSAIQTGIFNQSCALSNCHVGPNAPHGLDLSAGAAYDNLVGVASREVPARLRVAPGNPEESYLYMKIAGLPGIVAGRMPLGGTPLSDEQLDLVAEWIRMGALEN